MSGKRARASEIYAEPQHKLLFRVVRDGCDFLSSILVLSIVWKKIFFESAGMLSLTLVNKNEKLSYLQIREAFFIRLLLMRLCIK